MYRGRFAPTPSGPLHFGSLVAALGSYLDARAHRGQWLLRIEDVDPPRVVPGAEDSILRTLEAFGFEWSGPVMRQSQRAEAYHAALAILHTNGQVYPCDCSRKSLAGRAHRGVDGPVYPGTCRNRSDLPHDGHALRLRVPAQRILFDDGWQGLVACDIADECGDFVLRRADGVYTYQIASVVDDAEQGITHVVRGADLLTSTPRQIVLQQALHFPRPHYAHLPVVLDAHGDKLSKQTLAQALDPSHPVKTLQRAAAFLGLPGNIEAGHTDEFWSLATELWRHPPHVPIRARRPDKSL